MWKSGTASAFQRTFRWRGIQPAYTRRTGDDIRATFADLGCDAMPLMGRSNGANCWLRGLEAAVIEEPAFLRFLQQPASNLQDRER